MCSWLLAYARRLVMAPLLVALLTTLAGCGAFASRPARGATSVAFATPPARVATTVYYDLDGDEVALRTRDRAVIWRDAQVGGHSLLAGGALYVGGDALYALEPATGARRWRARLDSVVSGLAMFQAPSAAALVIAVTGASQYGAGGSAYGVRASDGVIVWRVRTDAVGAWAPPLVSGSTVYVTTDRSAYALDARSGRMLWRVTTWRSSGVFMATKPELAGGVLYAGTGGQAIVALRASDGALLWRYTVPGYRAQPIAVMGGAVYVSDTRGTLTALRAATGATLWRRAAGVLCGEPPLPSGVLYTCAPESAAPDSAFASLMAIDAATGATLWRAYPASQLASRVALLAGTLYVASHASMGGEPIVPPGALSALDPRTGVTRWSVPADNGAPLLPAVAA